MSGIAGFATVYSIVKALQAGNTYAGMEVNLEPGTILDEITVPTIDVYGGVGRVEVQHKGIQLVEERLLLRFELLAPPKFVISNGTFGPFTFDTASSPGAFLSLLWRQCLRVLLFDQSPFAAIARVLIGNYRRIEYRSELYEVDKGRRVGARTVELECDLLPEPLFGTPPQGIWAQFIEALRSPANVAIDPGAPALAALLEDSIADPVGAYAWQVEAAQIGVTADELRALGEGPLDEDAPASDHELVPAAAAIIADADEPSGSPDAAVTVNVTDPVVPEV